MTVSDFETVWDRGVLAILKGGVRFLGETIIRVGVVISDCAKSPDHKYLEYIFSPEAQLNAISESELRNALVEAASR